MPDYRGAPGRTGYAVGLDVPASVLALIDDLTAAGYSVSDAPKTARDLLDVLAIPRGTRRCRCRTTKICFPNFRRQ